MFEGECERCHLVQWEIINEGRLVCYNCADRQDDRRLYLRRQTRLGFALAVAGSLFWFLGPNLYESQLVPWLGYAAAVAGSFSCTVHIHLLSRINIDHP